MSHQDCIRAMAGCLPGDFKLCGSEGAHCWVSFPFQPQQSISASAVILPESCKGHGPGQRLLCKILITSGISQRWFRGHCWAQEGCSSIPDEFCFFISYVYVFFFLQKPLVKNRRGLVIIAGTSWCLLCAGIWICILSCDISYSHVSISILWMRKLRLNDMKSLVQVALLISDRPGHWALGHSHTWCKLLKKCHA